MLAKLIVHAPTRAAAIARAVVALKQFPVLGVRTNIPFLVRLLAHPAFAAGEVDTGFIDRELETLAGHGGGPVELAVAAAVAVGGVDAAWQPRGVRRGQADPWTDFDGWRN